MIAAAVLGVAAGCGKQKAGRRHLTPELEQAAAAHIGPCERRAMGRRGDVLVECTGRGSSLQYALRPDGRTVALIELSSLLPMPENREVLADAIAPLLTAAERRAVEELLATGRSTDGTVKVGDTSIEMMVSAAPEPLFAMQIRWRQAR